jgi:SAM-dependent methyltransferase
MKKIPEVKNDFKELYGRLLTNQETNIFIAAIELGVFQELSEWKSPEELAEGLHLNPTKTSVFLNSLASLDLIEKKDGRFKNSSVADEFLAVKNDIYLGDFLLSCYQWYNMSSGDICNLVRNGPGERCMPEIVRSWSQESEEMWAGQAKLSVNHQRSGMVQLATRLVYSLPEYPSFKKMLDLGCGPGLFGISMTMSHPSMTAVLFDRPAVARVAERVVEDYEMSDRIEVLQGDYITGPIGEDYDLVWASMTLDFAKDRMNEVITKIHDSLNPGGVFVSFSDGKTDEGTKPKEMVLGTLMPALYWDNPGLNEGIIAGSMIEAGFASVRSRTLMTPIGEVMLDIARKHV